MRSLSVQVLLTLLISSALFLSTVLGDSPIDLGFARPYAVLAGSAITSAAFAGTVVTGNIGLFPGTAVTGFPPAIVNGVINAANSASANAQGSLTAAYNIAAGKTLAVTLTDHDLGGMVLRPGVYKFDVAAAIHGVLTLDAGGNPNAVWTFQIGSTLLVGPGSSAVFKNGVGNADFVYWQVGSSATIDGGASMLGNIMALASITLNEGAKVNGRLLARNAAVSMDNNKITRP